MFEISEIRWITRLIKAPFYLAPKSTFEYLMFNDVEHFELLVQFDIMEWINEIKKIHRLQYRIKEHVYEVRFSNENIVLHLTYLKGSIESYLENAMFNIHAVSIAVSPFEHNAFDKYVTSVCNYYCSWVDPYHKRSSIKASYLEPIDCQLLLDDGEWILKMVHLMAEHNFDLHPELVHYIQSKAEQISFASNLSPHYMFDLLSYPNASKYIILMDELCICDKVYPVVKMLKTLELNSQNVWSRGLKCLQSFEEILYLDDYFVDSVSRAIAQALNEVLDSGLSKRQMIKFSILFYNAYLTMKLKKNSPERYEDTFESFCQVFELQTGACEYYSKVIQNNCSTIINLKDELVQGYPMSLEKQYEFYEEFQENTLDVLLIQYVDQLCDFGYKETYKKRLEYFIKNYLSKFCEIQSINSEITTLEIKTKNFSDASMIVLLEDVKKKIFMGNLRYDRQTIIEYINSIINTT